MTDESTFAAFIDRAYQDAGDLLVDMRDYITEQSSSADKAADPAERLLLTQALTRVTRQLTEVMAWLMVQKAVAAERGQLTLANRPEGGLRAEICLYLPRSATRG